MLQELYIFANKKVVVKVYKFTYNKEYNFSLQGEIILCQILLHNLTKVMATIHLR